MTEKKSDIVFKNPSVTVDTIVNYRDEGVVLIRRQYRPNDPNSLKWALPGGYINYGRENLEQAAARETKEETNLDVVITPRNQFRVYSNPDRDPRGHIVTTVFHVRVEGGVMKAGDDAVDIGIFRNDNLPGPLAFDHDQILSDYEEFINSSRQGAK